MVVKTLDPNTTTADEMAQAARSLRQARWAGIVAGLIALTIVWTPVMTASWLENSGLVLLALVVAGAGAYRLTYEVLVRVLPPN
jgi:hypothetical protein